MTKATVVKDGADVVVGPGSGDSHLGCRASGGRGEGAVGGCAGVVVRL